MHRISKTTCRTINKSKRMKKLIFILFAAFLMPSVLRAEESTPVDTLKGKDGNLYIISKGANGEVTGIQVARKDAKGALMKKGDLIPYLKDAAQQPGGKTASRVFDVVEVMPSFPGGDVAMMDFVMKNMKYPVDAEKKKVQGRVLVQFVVAKDGMLKDIRVARSVYPSLDEEALRVVKSMPKWIPGKQNGKPVNVKYMMPFTFKLN